MSDDRYGVKSMVLLAARARQALAEYTPLSLFGDPPERVYRTIRHGSEVEVFALDTRPRAPHEAVTSDTPPDATALLGREQLAWVKRRLVASRSTWKVMVASLPIGTVVRDLPRHFEAMVRAGQGAAQHRHLEIADLLRFIQENGVRNVVWITGDVHYCAAQYYNPERAQMSHFDPFWEFVAGPLSSGTFAANQLDRAFGPEVKFIGLPDGMAPDRPAGEDRLQFYGLLRIDPDTKALTASLHDVSGKGIYSVTLEAQ